MEMLKTQMQLQRTKGIFETFQSIRHQSGMQGLYRGLGMTMLRDGPALGLYFVCFETMIREMGESTSVALGAGVIAGIFSWLVSFPQDVIKTRLQADLYGTNKKYSSSWHCFQAGIKKEGPRFLFRGVGSTFIHSSITVASFVAYSILMRKLTSDIPQDYHDGKENLKDIVSDEETEILLSVAADGPHIPFLPESYVARLYPEQMLWASPVDMEQVEPYEEIFIDNCFSTFSNHNPFTQTCFKQVVNMNHTHGREKTLKKSQTAQISSPRYFYTSEERERLRGCITSDDFLLPTNLLSNRSNHDRIYGFYYLVV